MTALVESTEAILSCNGVLCRVWSGHTEEGVPLFMLVACLAVDEEDITPEIREAFSPIPVHVVRHLAPGSN